MKKQKKQLIILGIGLILIVGIYFLVKLIPEKEEKVVSTAVRINEISPDDVTAINFKTSSVARSFSKDAGGEKWIMEGYEDRDMEPGSINAMTNVTCGILAKTKIDGVTDYSEYGFDDPVYVVNLTLGSGTRTVTFGSYNSVLSVYYVMMDNDPSVYVYSRAEGLVFDNSTEYFLVEVEEETTETTGTEEEN